MSVVTRGFKGRRDPKAAGLPPGQYLTRDFPVLSAGPTPTISLDRWQFTITNESGVQYSWSWPQLMALPNDQPTVDIHCVTTWSKLGTRWRGVPLDVLFEDVDTTAGFAMVHSYGGYTTNVPLPTCCTASRGSPTSTTARAWPPSTVGRLACWCRTCTSGSRPSGSTASR